MNVKSIKIEDKGKWIQIRIPKDELGGSGRSPDKLTLAALAASIGRTVSDVVKSTGGEQ
ncbi:MAG: hypothetical protein AAF224_00960 [Pseudomonadota bacterium]